MISVIITTYKRPSHIVKRAINSVIAQTYKDWELYVVDDSPSDYEGREDIKTMVDSLGETRVMLIQQPTNMGANIARNTGIAKANGDYVAFLDDDDEWLPQKLEKQLAKIEEAGENTALVYCGYLEHVDATGEEKIHDTIYRDTDVVKYLFYQNFIGGASFPLIRKKALNEIGNFDEELLSSQDLDVWLRLSQKFDISYVEEPLVLYHFHDGEQITKNIKKVVAGRERIISKNKIYLSENREVYWRYLSNYSFDCAYCGAIQKSMEIYGRTIKIGPLFIMQNFLLLLRIFKLAITRRKG